MTLWTPDVSASTDPIYLAIAKAIVSDIVDGRLSPGDRLPPHRELARELNVSIGTVTRGYVEAMRRGVIRGETGRGTYVLGSEPERPGLAPWSADDGRLVDLSVSYPVCAKGPDLAAALHSLADRTDVPKLLRYHWPHIQPRYLQAGADWLKRHGVDVEPSSVVITAGAQHALSVIIAANSQPGDVMFTDELTYPGMIAVARLAGVRLQGIMMDAEGMIPEALLAACRQRHGRFLYCMPTVQNPTSAVQSEQRRHRLAEIAEEYDLLIIEDEVLRLLVPDAPPPIWQLAPKRTFFIASTTKAVAGGLRLAYIAAPIFAREPLRHCVWASIGLPAPLTVELATIWIEDGTADRITEKKRTESVARQGMAREILSGCSYCSHPTAYNVWLELPDGWESSDFAVEARRRGVGVTPSSAFAVTDGESPRAVRICLGAAENRDQLRTGLNVIAELLRCGPRRPSAIV